MYINDYNNIIEIDDIINQALEKIDTSDRKVFNKYRKIEIVVPCLYHRNDEIPYFDNNSGLSDIFDKVKYIDFPYKTTYKFPHHRESEVIVYDDFYNIDKSYPNWRVKELEKYTRISLYTNGAKCHFIVWVKGIGDE